MVYEYRPTGVCSQKITFELDNETVRSVKFTGGCNGNLKGISALTEGMNAQEVIDKLSSIKCGFKNTSCPAQLAKAISEAIASSKA